VASVEIRNIRKNFGTVPVIHGVSIDIQDGELHHVVTSGLTHQVCF
jgi:ABC-type sugar transport system ATPase subunit